MPHVAVTLEYSNGKAVDLALPLQVPIRLLTETLVNSLDLPTDEGYAYFLCIKNPAGLIRLSPNASLGEMSILHGTRLVLVREPTAQPVLPASAGLRARNGTFFPLRSRVTLIGRHDPKNGIFVEIDLTDLAQEPKIISRRHAQIEQDGGRFYITDLGSANGTRLNGQRLPPHQKTPLWPGDQIELGKNGVFLTFEATLPE